VVFGFEEERVKYQAFLYNRQYRECYTITLCCQLNIFIFIYRYLHPQLVVMDPFQKEKIKQLRHKDETNAKNNKISANLKANLSANVNCSYFYFTASRIKPGDVVFDQANR
jgi:hypothetical protein